MLRALLAFVLLGLGTPSWAQADIGSKDQVLAVIADWYVELQKRDDGRPYMLTMPGFIDASPHYTYVDTGAAVLGPPVYISLAATALEFDYEITGLHLNPDFAKVRVWEKGFFYARASQLTYERAASTLFVLERTQPDGKWLVLAHHSASVGIPPTLKTDPMPDLSGHPQVGTEARQRQYIPGERLPVQ